MNWQEKIAVSAFSNPFLSAGPMMLLQLVSPLTPGLSHNKSVLFFFFSILGKAVCTGEWKKKTSTQRMGTMADCVFLPGSATGSIFCAKVKVTGPNSPDGLNVGLEDLHPSGRTWFTADDLQHTVRLQPTFPSYQQPYSTHSWWSAMHGTVTSHVPYLPTTPLDTQLMICNA